MPLCLSQHANTPAEEVILFVEGRVIGIVGVFSVQGDKARIAYTIDRDVTLKRREILNAPELAALAKWESKT